MEEETNNLLHTCPMTGEEIVVTGISGSFPKSSSVQDFMENLYNKVDMISHDSKMNETNPGIPIHSGKINKLEKFDAQFFKVAYQQAYMMEPMAKKMLEHTYEAIFDSGNTYVTLKNKKVGVFTASYFTDFSVMNVYNLQKKSGLLFSGGNKAMMANRISYWMNSNGPSYCLDNSCASSTAALEQAYESIKTGLCDAAVVAACNTCISPLLSLNLKSAGLLCLDGKTKCFDKNGDGYVRSDAINVILLQKAKDAKRVYAEVCHTEGIYNLKDNNRFLPIPNVHELQNFLKNVYSKSNINPNDVEYVEANGAALAEADENEVEAIASVFTGTKVVKLGSVKSNMGNSEAASGLCSLTKLCLAYHKGEIPANIHLQDPIKPVKDGKVQVVTENTKFERGYTAFNDISFTGSSYHVIMKGHYKKKNLENYKCGIPRLVLISGRQESCVTKIFDTLKNKQIDAEEIALLHNIFQNDIVGHTGRGHIVLDTTDESTVAVSENVDHYSGIKTPLWFVFSGMGSQWVGMGADLMRIPTFAAAIKRCQNALQPYNIDLLKIITDLDNKIFDNSVHVFVGIGAVQIGLIDILKELGVVPDYIIGHSLGELACAYFDDTLTAEQTILSIYSRSIAVSELALIKGSMAAVGMGHKNLTELCPPDIDIACHNSSESSTISGPAEAVDKFVGELKKRGIFTKIVQTANVAYHSRYIAEAGPIFSQLLNKIIVNPKPRSDRWLSTSVPKEEWNDLAAKYSSAEYHANNLLKPVLFEEVLRLIPNKAVVVEIAPHGLLQAILKKSHEFCTHIPIANRESKDNVIFLFKAIGKLYEVGLNPKVDFLYPKVSFPVSTETPLLSHLIEWEHSENWPKRIDKENKKITYASRKIVFSLHDEDYKYLKDFIRNGVNILPEAALLAFVWETLAMYKEIDFRELSLVFENIQFHSEIIINVEVPIRLTIEITKGSGAFEVTEDEKVILSGTVVTRKHLKNYVDNDRYEAFDKIEADKLDSKDVYKILQMRGLNYRGKLQSIVSMDLDRTKAVVKWTGNWIAFLDSLIQLNIISRDYNGISKPKWIRILKISSQEPEKRMSDGCKLYDADINNNFGITRCAGVIMEGMTYTDVPLNEETADVIESQTFFPFYPTDEVNINTALKMSFQIITENSDSKNLLITKVVADKISKDFEFDFIGKIVEKFIFFNFKINELKYGNEMFLKNIENNEDKTNVILMKNLLLNTKIIKSLQNISKHTYILSVEDELTKMQKLKDCFDVLSCMSINGKKNLILIKRHSNYKFNTSYILSKFDDTFSWIPDVYNKLSTTKRVVFISEKQSHCGFLGFVKKLKMNGYHNISVMIVDDLNATKFDPDNEFYKEQLQKNMTINIMRNGQWGTFYYETSKLLLLNQTNFALKSQFLGNKKKLSWIEAPIISGNEKLVQVSYSGLSIGNCHNITHGTNREIFGMDFSGIDSKGGKIMGIVAESSVATTIEGDPDLLWPVPDHWTLEDAATVPLVYAQAYYCLAIRTKLKMGISILISDATSSVGLALISLCLSSKCTVFTVVDNEDKKKMLLRLYPRLDEQKIICSDKDGFYFTFMSQSMGQRCDIVVTFASSKFREAAAKCVDVCGMFLYIHEYDNCENMDFNMSHLDPNKSFTILNLSSIFKPENSREKEVLQKYIAQGIKSGVVKPLSRVVFSPANVNEAFRAINEHAGKVLMRIKDPSIVGNGLETIPRISYSAEDVLVMVCDEGGLALELADKLIERGAKKIILHKTNYASGYIQSKYLAWRKTNVMIKESSDNIQNKKECATFLKTAKNFGTVKGVFIVFDPKNTDNGTKECFINAFKKQSEVVMNLDMVTRNLADLSHFVVLSRFTKSVSDEYALSLTEKICDLRNKMGFPALVVQYQSLLELDNNELEVNKTNPQTLSALFNAIERSLVLNYTNVLTFDLKKIEPHVIGKDIPDIEDKMYTFYKHLDSETEKVTLQTVVEMPTLSSNGTLTNWVSNDSFIILVPGFEGRSLDFEPVAERLKSRAVAVQLGPELQEKCFEQTALFAREELRKTLNDKDGKSFSIMGYSFGVNVALELAAVYEREGRTGVVYCVDSSPDALRIILEDVLGKLSVDQLQNHVLNHMCNLINGKKGNELESDLQVFVTFEAKVNECLRRMKGVAPYSNDYKKSVLESAYNRIVMAQEYRPKLKLRSQLVLMKSSNQIMASKLADDYDLSKYSYKPIKIYPLLADNLVTVLNDCRVSNIVNSFVDAKDLENFKKKNLCDVYYI